MKKVLRIAWMYDLEDLNIQDYAEYITQKTLPPKVDEYSAEGDTEDNCLYKIYKQLFYDNWTAENTISRWMETE